MIYTIIRKNNNSFVAENDEETVEFESSLPFWEGDRITFTDEGVCLINELESLLAKRVILSLANIKRNEELEGMYRDAKEIIAKAEENLVPLSYKETIEFLSFRQASDELIYIDETA